MPRWLFAAVATLVVGMASPALAQDPHVGTWKENLAKSKSTPAPTTPAPKSVTWKYEVADGNGLKLTIDTVGADGKLTTTTPYTAHVDGKDYPYLGSTAVDAIMLKRVDASSWE